MGVLQPAKNSDEDVGAPEIATGFTAGVELVTSPGAFVAMPQFYQTTSYLW